MTDIRPILEQIRTFAESGGQVGFMTSAVVVGLVSLLLGIGISVLGAKLARPGATFVLGVIGAAFGIWFARTAGLANPFAAGAIAVIGAGMFGTIAHRTFPIWVGVVTGIVFSGVSLGALGGQRVLPYYTEFAQAHNLPAAAGEGFTLPSSKDQEAYLDKTPREFANDFWAFVTERDAEVATESSLLGVAAGVVGLFLGVIAARWMLILSTSLLGTALLTAGVTSLLYEVCSPESFQALQSHDSALGISVGAFLVTSLILQALLTRKGPTEKPRAAVGA